MLGFNTGLINVFNYWNWGLYEETKRVRLREEILVGLVLFKLEYHSVFGL
jgi:hypothetical protein